MNKEYLKINEFKASIHTVTVRSAEKPQIPPTLDKESVVSNYLQRSGLWSLKINPNKIHGDVFSYKEYNRIVGTLFEKLGISYPIYYRTDLRIDSYEDNFKQLYKINLLLISLFAMSYRKNQGQAIAHLCTQSKDFCDVSYSNEYVEMKFYDKRFQTNDADPAKARLEIRCLKNARNEGLPPHEFAERIFAMMNTLPSQYELLQSKCNEALYDAYLKHCNYCGKSERIRDYTTEFLSNYSNTLTIFTRQQLRDFLKLCGLSDSQAYDRGEYIIRKTHIEFFSKADISRYLEKLKSVISTFFVS